MSMGSESASFIVQAWPALSYLSEAYYCCYSPGFMFRLYLWLECTFHWEMVSEYKGNDFKNLKLMKNFFFSSAAGPLLPLAQRCKGKQIAKLNRDLKIGRLLYLALSFSQGENKRAVPSVHSFFLSFSDLKNRCWDSPRWEASLEWSFPPEGKSKGWEQQVSHSLESRAVRSCVRDSTPSRD